MSAEWQYREKAPYLPANKASVKSGAWSPDLIAETVEELRPALQRIVDSSPWITPIDVDALEDYLYDRARLARLERWLAERGDRYPDGHVRAGELRERDLRELGTLRRRCMDHRRVLLLEPASRSRARLDQKVFDLAALMAELDSSDNDAEYEE